MTRQGTYTKKVSFAKKAKRSIRRRWKWFSRLPMRKKILLIATPILAFLILTPILTYLYYAKDISDQERLMNRNNTGIVLTDQNGEIFYRSGRAQHREMLPLDQMSSNVKEALLSSEDKDFYKHGGFSVVGIIGALYANIASGDATAYGGSTLTQQLAKITLLSDNQTFMRKYQELAVSIAIEREYTKDQILEMYLNSAYFGENAFGIEDAAKVYYGKAPKDLTLGESAMLIGLLPAPSAYSPITGNPEYARERQTTVLTRMVDNNKISKAEKEAALAEKLVYAGGDSIDGNNNASHFAQMVLEELYDKYGEEKVHRSGYQVQTTLDLAMQREMSASIADHIDYIRQNGGSNAASIAIDPSSGEIRALVGSADWNNQEWGKVNMTTTPRQPGSSFKPIYYAKALADNVITPATILEDVPTDFNGYKPQNASRTFSGDVTVRKALNYSLNIPAVKVMQKLGVHTAAETAKKMGISTIDPDKDYGLSLALGSAEASLVDMTNAYAAFANKGKQFEPKTVKQIKNKYDQVIFTAREEPRQVISEEGAYLISNILSDNNARAGVFGSSLNLSGGRKAAVKTGTTDESRDAWTIGYTPQLAVGVWVGNNDNAPMDNGGAGMAGPIWVKTMNEALRGAANAQFEMPAGIVQRSVCYTGGLASQGGYGTYTEYFLAWGLPTTSCTPPEEPKKEEPKKEDVKPDKEKDTKKDTKPQQPTEPTEPTQPTEPEQPTPPPTEPTEPTAPTRPTEPQTSP